MYPNRKYIYLILMQNSKPYWKFLVGYVTLLLLLFGITTFYFTITTSQIILSIFYIVSLWVATVWLTVLFLKKLFTENKFLNWKIFERETVSRNGKIEGDESNVSQLSKNIEEQFINYWYKEISTDKTFTKESRIFIQNTLKMIVDVVDSTEKSELVFVVGNIYLRHLKEFRRALKLKDKNGAKLSDLYRYSCSTMNTPRSCDFFIHQMTKNMLINFVHWELWNSIPCQLVVSILSNKLSYLIDLCTNPNLLNYYLLKIFIPEEQKLVLNLDNYSYVKLEIETDDKIEKRKKKISQILIEEEIVPKEDEKCNRKEKSSFNQKDDAKADSTGNEISNFKKCEEAPETLTELNLEPCSDHVKVYEPKSASRTWDEVLDLDSITLGEDPLGSSSNSDTLIESDYLIVDNMRSGDATANTLRDIKDFQENTVNTVVKPMSHATSQALHKIGDLQDEAAGVVEGLFDFGMAGLRRGLKLTGLQDQSIHEVVIPENKVKHGLSSPGTKILTSNKKTNRYSKAEIAEECVWLNPLQGSSNSDEDVLEDRGKIETIPSISMETSEYESPDPEYEEAADLATTIAKLRSLLQQKSSESNTTTPNASPMVSEDSKSIMDLDEVDSFVPSFYKLCAKTATGVFNNTLNTIKTALPVNDDFISYDMEKWDYEDYEDEQQVTLLTRMNKLLQERKDFCTIETAYDAFDSQQPTEGFKSVSDINFQDELDEFEAKVPLAKTLLDIVCELIAESDSFISQEPFVRFILLVFGLSIDETISTEAENLLKKICITEIPINNNQETLTMELDLFVDNLMSGIPEVLIFIIGQSTLRDALSILVSSIQIKKCNQDLIFQVLEFISLKIMEGSSNINSMYST